MTSYHGGKQRIGETIAHHIASYVANDDHWDTYVEPFAGMCGVYRHIPALLGKRTYVAGDINESVVKMWTQVQRGWIPPLSCTESTYNRLKRQTTPSAEKGYIGHQFSFGGQYFKGYRGLYENKETSRCSKSQTNVLDIGEILANAKVKWYHGSYDVCSDMKNAIMYLDPPYEQGSEYFDEEHTKRSFDTRAFWDWCLRMSKHNVVFVSEYSIPRGYKKHTRLIYETDVHAGHSHTDRVRTEKLYVVTPR